MTRPVSLRPSASALPSRPVDGGSRAEAFARSPEAEASVPRAVGGFREALRQQLVRLSAGERAMDAMVRGPIAGRALGTAELLAMQAGVYRYGQEVELLSRLVDRASGAVKQTLQSQT